MRNLSRRIGSTDYIITELFGGSVRFDEVPSYNEKKKLGKEYKSIEKGIQSIQSEHLKKFTRHVFTIEEVIKKNELKEFGFNYRIWEAIYSKNGDLKKTGFVVIITGDKLSDSQGWGLVKYCRGKKNIEEIQIENQMLMDVIDTTTYTPSQMFSLNHGMSMERYMST